MTHVRMSPIGGRTALIAISTADRPDVRSGRRYDFGWGTGSVDLVGPSVPASVLGPIDAVLLAHDHHGDNLDPGGRALLPSAGLVVTTESGAPTGLRRTGLRPTATRAYSVRDQFPDQWYDLHNPPAPDAAATVELPVSATDFPTNVSEVTTLHLAVYVVPAGDAPLGPVDAVLRFTPTAPGRPPVEGQVTSTPDGIVSTRSGNAATWIPMLGGSPLGGYRLTFPDTAAFRTLLDQEAVADLALVITYSGRTPAWPE